MSVASQTPQLASSAIQFIETEVTKNSITIEPRKPWQPSVVALRKFEKEWTRFFKISFMAFYDEHVCKIPNPRFSISMQIMSFSKYVKDPRSDRNLFLPLTTELHASTELLIFFPRDYTINALEQDLTDVTLQFSTKLRENTNNITEELRTFFKINFPDYYFKIIPFGSRCYGAYLVSTDFNFCIVMDDPDLDWIVKNRDKCINRAFIEPAIGENLLTLLGDNSRFNKASFDPEFDTMRYQSTYGNVEFVFNKEVYTESTNLINHYAELDDRVGKLLFVVKNFIQLRSVTKGGLHGYGVYQYILMMLAYLQQLDPPVIPNLQHLGFGHADCCQVASCRTNSKYWDTALYHKRYVGANTYYHTCVRKNTTMPKTPYSVASDNNGGYYWHSSNTSMIGELLLDFFYHYGYKFDFQRQVVSIKHGGFYTKEKSSPVIIVEDPFLTGVNTADPIRSTRGLSFFIGAFLIMYNEELCFAEVLRYSGLIKIPENKRFKNTKMPYQALVKKSVLPANAVCLLLIDLPKCIESDSCVCNALVTQYRQYGHIIHIETLDSTTKRVYLSLIGGYDGNHLSMPPTFKTRGKVAHVSKLYGFTLQP